MMTDVKLNEIKEKITKETIKLESLIEQKKKIEIKINNKKNEIEKLNDIISQEQFNEMTDILNAKGLDMEKVINMLKNNNFNLNEIIPTSKNQNSEQINE